MLGTHVRCSGSPCAGSARTPPARTRSRTDPPSGTFQVRQHISTLTSPLWPQGSAGPASATWEWFLHTCHFPQVRGSALPLLQGVASTPLSPVPEINLRQQNQHWCHKDPPAAREQGEMRSCRHTGSHCSLSGLLSWLRLSVL